MSSASGAAAASASSSSSSFVPEVHIVCDATGSMGVYLESLKMSVVQIASLLRIISPDARLGMRAYRDMCDCVVTETVPMRSVSVKSNYDALLNFVQKLRPSGGGDTPEACKRGLFESLEAKDVSQGTIVLLYTDAPPHLDSNGATGRHSNGMAEKAWFESKNKKDMWDWVCLARAYASAGARVYSFVSGGGETIIPYAALAAITGGQCFNIGSATPSIITATTMHTLLSLFGCGSGDLAKGLESGVSARCLKKHLETSLMVACATEASIKNATSDLVDTSPVSPLGQVDLQLLPRRFKNDASFREVVFEVIGFLLTDVQHAMALTTNAVFGTLWRAICCCRDDPRRDQLVDVMGKLSASPQLSSSDREKLSTWLTESYDQSGEILRLLSEAITTGGIPAYPAIILSDAGTKEFAFSQAKELLEIARVCDADTMSRITSLLTHLTVVQHQSSSSSFGSQTTTAENKDEDADGDVIDASIGTRLPLGLKDRDLFELLPHLMCPGTRFSLRPAIIIAAIAYLADVKVLKVQAERFLRDNKGKWFTEDQAENFSVGFIRLMNRLPVGLGLTDTEAELFEKLKLVSSFAANVQSTYDVEIGYKPSHQEARISDHRPRCSLCQCYRSFTLMVRDPEAGGQVVCSTCYWKARPSEDDTVISANGQRELDEDAVEAHTSHMAECRSCHSLYAVVRTGDLNVEPKCHACRFDKGFCRRVSCTECQNTFVDPAELFNSSVAFKCGACTQAGRPLLKSCTATLQELVVSSCLSDDAFKAELGVHWKVDDANKRRLVLSGQMRKPLSLAEMVDIKVPGGAESNVSAVPIVWKLNDKRIADSARLVTDMNTRIRSGEGQVDTCYLCCRDLPCDAMKPACGSCPARSCTSCLAAWYGALQPGSLVLPAHFACPFCKAAPKPAILAKFNREACTIRRAVTGPTAKLSLDFYYAWCKSCYRIKELVERRCTDGTVPECTAFECEECRVESASRAAKAKDPSLSDAEIALLMGKPCPACGIQVSKTSGCNHMTCPDPCNSHWCYECGELQTEGTIYDHMQEEHGSYYDWEY